MDKTERKSSLPELANHINIVAVLGEWKKLLDSAQKYEFMSECERKETNKTVKTKLGVQPHSEFYLFIDIPQF